MKTNRNSRRQYYQDVHFVRKAGQLMLQWEQQRMQEVETHMFWVVPEVQAQLECIQSCISGARIPPVSFTYAFDPVYNQIIITLEDYVFSDYSYPLQDILGQVDAYSIDARKDGCLVLNASINNAAYEMEA